MAYHGPDLAELQAWSQSAVNAHTHDAHRREHHGEQRSGENDHREQQREQPEKRKRPAVSVAVTRPVRANARDHSPNKLQHPGNKHAHQAYDQRKKSAAVQLAVFVAEYASRHGRMHVPSNIARPSEQVSENDNPPEHGDQSNQRQHRKLAEPTRRVLDIVPGGAKITCLHSEPLLLLLSFFPPYTRGIAAQ